MNLKEQIREIPDYPKKGINFKDITTLLKNSEALNFVIDAIVDEYKDKGITKVLGLEARGFIFGGAIAARLNAGFVPVRKKGKLPATIISETYALEYGTDRIEMHIDAVKKKDVVLIHDDLLATGGTAYAAVKLLKQLGVKVIYLSFICDLEFLETPVKKNLREYKTHVLVKYQ